MSTFGRLWETRDTRGDAVQGAEDTGDRAQGQDRGEHGTQDSGDPGYKGHRTGNAGSRAQNREGTAGGARPARFWGRAGAGVSRSLLCVPACFARLSLPRNLVIFFFSIIDSTAIQQRMSFVKTTNEPIPPPPFASSPHTLLKKKKKKQKAAQGWWESSGGASEGLGLGDQGPCLRAAEAVTTESRLIHHLLICIRSP